MAALEGYTPELVQHGKHDNLSITTRDFWFFYGGVEGEGRYVLIPKGTITNKASVPSALMWLWNLIPEEVRNAWVCAFVIHDRMVGEFGQEIPPIRLAHELGDRLVDASPSRRTAAKWMKRAVKHSGRWVWMRGPLYELVRVWDRWVKIKKKLYKNKHR